MESPIASVMVILVVAFARGSIAEGKEDLGNRISYFNLDLDGNSEYFVDEKGDSDYSEFFFGSPLQSPPRSNRFKRFLGLANIRSVLLPSVKQWYHQFSPRFVRVDEYVPQYGRRHPRAANFPQLTDDKDVIEEYGRVIKKKSILEDNLEKFLEAYLESESLKFLKNTKKPKMRGKKVPPNTPMPLKFRIMK